MHEMKHGKKRYVPAHRRVRIKKWRGLATVLALLLIGIVSGVSLAVLHEGTPPLENTFIPAEVSCDVIETFDGVTKSDVRIKNTGKASSYIRAAIVATWVSDEGGAVSAVSPVEGTDYEVILGDLNWKKGADGFWYYTVPVEVGGETADLIESCVCTVSPPEGFSLSVEIVASSVQSYPASVVTTYWSSGVSGTDGTVLQIIEEGDK